MATADFKVHYRNGVWYTHIPYEAKAAREQLRDAGWKFHWGDKRDYYKCSACRANIEPMANFTWDPMRAAVFRDNFDEEAEKAFKQMSSEHEKKQQRTNEIYEQSFATDDSGVTMDTPAPPGLRYRPYQRAGIQWIVNREGTLLGDPPGLGKTIQVLGAVNALADVREVLVIAPSALAANWAREANKWVDRPVTAVFMRDSSDIPPPAKPGSVNIMSMAYDSVPQTKGDDLDAVLKAKDKKGNPPRQTDYLGLRRALKKVANRKTLRRILVIAQSADEPIDWSKAMTPKLSADLGEAPKIFRTTNVQEVTDAQAWLSGHPNKLAVVVIEPSPEETALAAMTGDPSPYVAMQREALGFSMPGQRSSRQGKKSSGYDLVLTDKLRTLRTMGRGLGLVDDLMQRPLDMLVLDEAHILNNPKNETSIGVFGKWNRETQLSRGLGDIAKRRVYLTGTPLRNKTCEMYGPLRSLAPKAFKNFWRFASRFCDATKTKFGWTFDGRSNEDELSRLLRSGTEHGGLMIRREKSEVEKDLPPKTRIVLPLPVPEEAEDLISEEWVEMGDADEQMDLLEAQMMIAEIEGNEEAYKQAVSKLNKVRDAGFESMAGQRARIAEFKIKPVVEFVEGLLDGGVEKVGIFATHRVLVEGLTQGLRKHGGVAIIDGRVAGKGRVVPPTGDPKVMDRIEVVDAFQTDPKVRVFIGNYKAAKEGWTLTAASTAVMAESTWTAADNEQAEDRFHRIGTVNPVTIYYTVFDGSLDQKMLEAVVRKMETAQSILDAHYDPVAPKRLSNVERIKLNETLIEKPERREVRQRGGGAGKEYTEEQREAAHQGIQMLASVCDGAVTRDCRGFGGGWVDAGHWLASQPSFDNRMTAIAVRAITHHQRQIPDNILEVLGIRRKGMATEPPVRYRTVKERGAWRLEMTTTMVDQPVQVRILYPIVSHEGDLKDGREVVKTESGFIWDGGSLTVSDEGKRGPEELGIPEPNTKKPVRWRNGHWQRELASGWKDFEPKWIDDPKKAVPVPKGAPKPKAPSKKPTPAKAPTPKAPTPKKPTPKKPTPAKAPSKKPTPAKAPSRKRASKAKPQPKLYIQAPEAFEILSEIEGPVWAELQRRDEGRLRMDNGFHLNLAAYRELEAMGELGEGITLMDLDEKAGLLEGTKGAAYIVMPDGEIMLLADTVTKTKARKAAKFMQVVEE
jgi:hypothetical protein